MGLGEVSLEPPAPSAHSAMGEEYVLRLQKAMGLLQTHWLQGCAPGYDLDHALVLCRMHDFRQGALYLLERMGLYQVRCLAGLTDSHLGLCEC